MSRPRRYNIRVQIDSGSDDVYRLDGMIDEEDLKETVIPVLNRIEDAVRRALKDFMEGL